MQATARRNTPSASRTPSLQALGPRFDPKRLRIEPLPDMLLSQIPARNVWATVEDADLMSLWWELRDPGDRRIATQTTDANALESFPIAPSQFSAPGVYHLTCVGLDASGLASVQAVRDFRIVRADLAAAAGTAGTLQFTQYQKTDAPAKNQPYRVDTKLQFHPSQSVGCAQIGWLQTAQALGGAGLPLLGNVQGAEVDARQTPLSWTIDRKSGAPSPFYGTFPDAQGNVGMHGGFGHFGGASPRREALLTDAPGFEGTATIRYESCAVCRGTHGRGEVYGCATWGFSADDAGRVTLHPRGYSLMPSNEFMAAHAQWNLWNASLPVADRREDAPELTTPRAQP